MSNLIAARSQMAVSLGFHIIFSAIGIAMPLLMVIAEWLWLRTGDETYLTLTKRWARGTAIFFAVGAVSGTMLSFELGLLWPEFMRISGAVIGVPFALEGFAFFTEAIFLGIYLYGWRVVSSRGHLVAGIIVASSGALSGLFVVMANSWMNTPAGFQMLGSHPTGVHPLTAMLNPAASHEVIHMLIAAYQATGFAVAAIHGYLLRKNPADPFHRKALAIALAMGCVVSLPQILVGDFNGSEVARLQPIKLAALEGQFRTEQGAPLRIGGLPDPTSLQTRYAVEIPRGLSLLAFHNPNATVQGLEAFPRDRWPPVPIVHVAFQVMVACGSAMALLAMITAVLWWRTRALPDRSWFLWLVTAAGPLGMIAIEAGWTVTEVGRQPWIIYNILRTKAALTPMPGLVVPFATICVLYLLLGITVILLFKNQVVNAPEGAAHPPHDETRQPGPERDGS